MLTLANMIQTFLDSSLLFSSEIDPVLSLDLWLKVEITEVLSVS